jgi:hypothetical protein
MKQDTQTADHVGEYSTAVSIMFAIGAALSFIVASYLARGSIQLFFSYHGADGTTGYASSISPSPLGVHYFGDYLLPRWQSELSSPWYISDISQGPINNYLPFTMGLFWIFSQLPYWPSFMLYIAIPLLAILVIVWKSLEVNRHYDRLKVIIVALVMTSPFVSMLDRGNVQIWLVAAMAISVFLFLRDHQTLGAVFLGVAIALKGYPIFLIALWVRARRWRDVSVAVATSALLTLVPLVFYEGGITRNLNRILRNVRLNEDIYSSASLAFNNSLRGTLQTLESVQYLGIGDISGTLDKHFEIVIAALLLCFVLIFLIGELDHLTTVILSCSIMSMIVDYVAPYALGVFFLVLLVLSKATLDEGFWRTKLLWLLLAIHMMPKSLPLRFWTTEPSSSGVTYASLLGGLTSTALFVLVGTSALKARFSPRSRKI